jgi:hypothetical protein
MQGARPDSFDRTNGHTNRNTGTDAPHSEYTGFLHVDGELIGSRETYTFRFRAPVEIMNEITSEDADKVGMLVGDHYVKMVANAVVLGIDPGIARAEAERTYVENIYRLYVLKQKRKGTSTGKLAWLVPASMQHGTIEEN